MEFYPDDLDELLPLENLGHISKNTNYSELYILDVLQNRFFGMIESFKFYVFLVFFALANSNITV